MSYFYNLQLLYWLAPISSKNLKDYFIFKNIYNKAISPFCCFFSYTVKLSKEKQQTNPVNFPYTLQPSNVALLLPPLIKTALSRSSMLNPKGIFSRHLP